MAEINREEPKTGHSSNASDPQLDEKLQYEETTTFSDPLPNKDVAFVGTASDSDEDGEALRKNPFLDPDVAEHWTAVYEKSHYECRGIFDPSFNWTEEEERKLVRKLDWRVCLWAVRPLISRCNRSSLTFFAVCYVFWSASRSWKSSSGCLRQSPQRSEPYYRW
jgi:hypothetical protein